MVSWSNIQLSVRAAAVVSLVAAQLLQLEYPIYAFIAAVIVTDLQLSVGRRLGLWRIVATVVGALCVAVLTFVLPPGPWGVGAGFFIAMLLAQLLKAGVGARVAGKICEHRKPV